MISKIIRFFSQENLQASKLVVALLVALASTGAYLGGLFDSFESVTLDQRFKVRSVQFTYPKIVVVEIAEDSIEHVGRWPWSRDWHATIVKALTEFGAKAVAFDVLFSEPSNENADLLFSKTIEKAGNVYLPVAFKELHGSQGIGVIRAIPILREAARGEGHISITPDPDGLLRRIKLKVAYEGRDYLQLGFKMALDFYGTDISEVKFKKHQIEIPIANNPPIHIPTGKDHEILINWTGTWAETFKHVSFIDVVVAYAQWLKGKPTRIPTDTFKDAFCIVGVTSTGLYDIRSIPLEPAYPAVGVNLHVLNSLLEKDFLHVWGVGTNLIVLWVLSAIIFVVLLRTSYLMSIVWIVTIAVVYTVFSVLMFSYFSIVTSLVYPLFLIFFSYLVLTAYHQIVINLEKKRLLKLATKDSLTGLFNIGHFKLLLGAELKSVELRKNKALSIVMVDVDHFKKFNDTYGHAAGDEVLRVVAEILRTGCRSLDVAARYGGEEFVLMLPGTEVNNAALVAEKIRKTLEQKEFQLGSDKQHVKVTASFGVAAVRDGEAVDSVMKRADEALYAAKKEGRNQVKTSN